MPTPLQYRDFYDDLEQPKPKKYWGREAAGCIFIAEDTGRILLAQRTSGDNERGWQVEEPGTWGTWGGKIDAGEDPKTAVQREIEEESGVEGDYKLAHLYTYKDGDFRYYNYAAVVKWEFTPQLNWESDSSAWVEFGEWPDPMHFGFEQLIRHAGHKIKRIVETIKKRKKFQMTELTYHDEFESLPISRQRKWQLRNKKQNKCLKCNDDEIYKGNLCFKHYALGLVANREAMRRKLKLTTRRPNSNSYSLQKQLGKSDDLYSTKTQFSKRGAPNECKKCEDVVYKRGLCFKHYVIDLVKSRESSRARLKSNNRRESSWSYKLQKYINKDELPMTEATPPPPVYPQQAVQTKPKSVHNMTNAYIVAATIWQEAKGEGTKGMQAVLNVIMNRAKGDFDKATNIVLRPKQFSVWNGVKDPKTTSFAIAKRCRDQTIEGCDVFPAAITLVDKAMRGNLTDITGGATFYFNPDKVTPSWAKKLTFTTNIGHHAFYKIPEKVDDKKKKVTKESLLQEGMSLERAEEIFAILKVPNATRLSPEELKRAWKELVIKYHPDKHPPHEREQKTHDSQLINAAYDVLKTKRGSRTDNISSSNINRKDFGDLNYCKQMAWEISGKPEQTPENSYTIWNWDGYYFRGVFSVFAIPKKLFEISEMMQKWDSYNKSKAVFVSRALEHNVVYLVNFEGKEVKPPTRLEHNSFNQNPDNDSAFLNYLRKSL